MPSTAKRFCLAAVLSIAAMLACNAIAAADAKVKIMPDGPIDPTRVDAIAAMLDDAPFVPGPKLSDRDAWAKLAATPAYSGVLKKADALLKKPMLEMTFEVYSEYVKTGERTKHYADVRANRHDRIALYTLAECIENKGRFIQPLQDVIASVCAEPTWTFNFHDPNFDYWNGKDIFVDLGAFMPAHDMTMSLGLLGDKLDDQTRQLIVDNCTRRILDPYRDCITGKKSFWWWIDAKMNWNSVCHEGVVGVALGLLKDKHDRAFFVAAAEKYTPLYIEGFGGDGYCAEGMGYWNYGFGHYLMLAEEVSQATHSGVNLFAIPGAAEAAAYPANIEIINGVTPAYADGGGGGGPDPLAWTFACKRFALHSTQWQAPSLATRAFSVASGLLYSCPNSATAEALPTSAPADDLAGSTTSLPHTYFQNSGIVTCRPGPGSTARLGVSLKGGNNDEPHNHNDLGTFVAVVGDQALVCDPGQDTYTAQTFSKDRYLNPMLNSFGHPVPRIAGALQRPGKDAIAKISDVAFSANTDSCKMDLSTAYAVPSLKSLTRSFVYDRRGEGSLAITDVAAFDSPQAFESALITYGHWQQEADGSILIWQHDQAARVTIDAGGAAIDVTGEPFSGKKIKPTRIAVRLHDPAAAVKLTMTLKPAAAPPTTEPATQP